MKNMHWRVPSVMHVDDAFATAIDLANTFEAEISFEFNEKHFVAIPGSTKDDLGKQFDNQLNATPGDKDGSPVFSARHMDMRDWFAGKALCGWAAGRGGEGFRETSAHDMVAQACYKFSDAMLKARKR